MRVLVVDGANVVGSLPDGWWRDRAGAAGRLAGRLTEWLAGAGSEYDEVVLVLEGKARPGRAVGREGALVTVHASGSGDDEIVEQAGAYVAGGHEVTVVTADRELRHRVETAGGACLGPGLLLGQL